MWRIFLSELTLEAQSRHDDNFVVTAGAGNYDMDDANKERILKVRLCVNNPPITDGFPSQWASYAGSVSMS